MTDEVVSAPGGGAPTSGGGSAPSAPAAPSTPAPAAAATVTPAAPAAPVVPAVDASKPPARMTGETDDAYMKRGSEWAKANPVPTGDEKQPEAPVPAATVEAPKPEEKKEEVAPKVEEAKLEAPVEQPPSKFAEDIAKNEKITAALEEAGIKDEFFEELRTAEVGRQFQEIFPDVQTAQFARQQAEGFAMADDAASNLKRGDITSTQQFVRDVLMPMSYVLKEDGSPEMVEIDNGRGGKIEVPKTDGTIGVMLDNFRDLAVDQSVADAQQMLEWATRNPNDPRAEKLSEHANNLMAALDLVKSHFAGQGVEEEELTPGQKEAQKKIDADKQALAETKTNESKERFENFKADVMRKSDEAVDGRLAKWLDDTSLAIRPEDSEQTKLSKEAMRKSVITQSREALYAVLNKDRLFLHEQEQAGRRGASATKDIVGAYLRNIEGKLTKVVEPILKNFGHEKVRQANARSEKVAAQVKQSQREERAGSQPVVPAVQKVDELELMRQAAKDLRAELKREPNDDEKVARWNQMRAKAATAKPV